jgi:hypothetical protein
VTLEGVIFDERIRDAPRMAAQNVTGVTAIDDQLVMVEPASGTVGPRM